MSGIVNVTGARSGIIGTTSGLAVASGIVQTVYVLFDTAVNTGGSTSYVDTGLALTITPLYADSKILVLFSAAGIVKAGGVDFYGNICLVKDNTVILIEFLKNGGDTGNTDTNNFGNSGGQFLHTHSTAPAEIVYKLRYKSSAGANFLMNNGTSASSMTALEIKL